MNDPVLDRAMFRNQAPVSSYGTGITSNVASPDEAARALQMAFHPTGYAGGGQVINGVKHFKKGGENDISPSTDVGDVLDDYTDAPSESSGLPPNFKFSEPSASFKSPEVQALYDATLAETGNPNAAMARVLRAYPNEMMMASQPPAPGPRGGGFRPAAPRYTPPSAPGPLPPRFVPGTLASQPAGGPPPVVAAPAAGGARYPSPPAGPSQFMGEGAGKALAGTLAPASVATAAGIPSLSELRGMAERSRDRLNAPPEAAQAARDMALSTDSVTAEKGPRYSPPITGLFQPRSPAAAVAGPPPEAAEAARNVALSMDSAPADPRYKRIGTSVYDYFFGGKPKPTAGVGAVEAKPPTATPPPEAADAARSVALSMDGVAPPAAGGGQAAKKPDEDSALGKRLTLRIDELKQEREANKAQRRENQLLALMQAGFQAAAGKSSSALTNIAGGGAAGIATLADLEKTRRAEDASLRKEALELELAKEKMIESGKERAAQRQLTAEQRAVQDRNNQAINLRQAHDSLGSRINSLDTKLLTMSNDPTAAAEVRKTRDELQVKYDALDAALISMFGKQGAMPAATLPVRVISSSPTGK